MASTSPRLPQRINRPWVKTVSGIAAVTAAGSLPTVTAAAPDPPDMSPAAPPEILSERLAQQRHRPAVAIAPALAGPRFAIRSLRRPSPLEQLEARRQQLRRQQSQTETQLAQIQHLLALEVYSPSFADELLSQSRAYQLQLRELQRLEARSQSLDAAAAAAQAEQRLQRLAQEQLARYIDQHQTDSALWQEPMYHSSLGWLMEATHQRHLLLARQHTVAQAIDQLRAGYTADAQP